MFVFGWIKFVFSLASSLQRFVAEGAPRKSVVDDPFETICWKMDLAGWPGGKHYNVAHCTSWQRRFPKTCHFWYPVEVVIRDTGGFVMKPQRNDVVLLPSGYVKMSASNTCVYARWVVSGDQEDARRVSSMLESLITEFTEIRNPASGRPAFVDYLRHSMWVCLLLVSCCGRGRCFRVQKLPCACADCQVCTP